MESEGRARKRRKRENVENVGKYVRKNFEGYGVFLGKVVSFADGLYRVDYEDGDFEDLESHEVVELLVNLRDLDDEFKKRRKQLDELVANKKKQQSDEPVLINKSEPNTTNEVYSVGKLSSDVVEADTHEEMEVEVEGIQEALVDRDADSSSDSSEFVQIRVPENDIPLTPPPDLPSSSGNVGVPEESISHLFSVYSFLRSFSIQLFISPFKLDDFVGSLNCGSSNTLMDAVHHSLLRALKRHLEMLSSDGAAKLASICLRRLDWSLLDPLTWPTYLVEYLLVMGYAKGPEWQGFYTDVLDGEYYSISVSKKLMILQILCDDVTESAELRAEVDMRERLEVGNDINVNANPLPPLNGMRRVHPKYSKTPACKDLETINAKPHNFKTPQGTNLSSEVPELDTDTTDIDQDENSDECQLCGMDGTLICCDGCPSAYHSRCIGLNKMLIPDGLWFCPECTAKKDEPTLRISAGLRSAEIFGIDPYTQVYLGICNHLLVLDLSIGSGQSSRYYNETDIPKVLQVLCSTEQHKTLYSGICKNIMQYWEILDSSNLSLAGRSEAEINTGQDAKEDTKSDVLIYSPDKVRNAVEGENCVNSASVSSVENGVQSGRENSCQEVRLESTSVETVTQDSQQVLQRTDDVTAPKPSPFTEIKSCEPAGTDSLVSSGSINHYPDHSDLTQQSCAERPTGLDLTTCTRVSNGDTVKEPVECMLLPQKNDSLSMSCDKVEGKSDGGVSKGGKNDGLLYMGDIFKPQSYTNQYFLGDIAASAAANYAVLALEAKGITDVHASSNPRKLVAADMALQLKAFSSASIRFIWPNADKKVMEVPRERCGWCLACKANTSSRKGCFLNLASSNAIKGSARNNVGLRPIKNAEGTVPGIATYILYMAESLRGFLLGPFLSSSYRRKWRKEVEEASSCSALKVSLLELEEHIRLVAFSADWVKLVDDWMVESSAVQNTTSSVGAPPKRQGGRRNRKQAAASEVAADPGDNDSRKVNWWRGGKLSKLVFQKGILPCTIIRKAARQGGRRKISGVYYAEGSEVPKRSRRFAWRAAVEMSRNAPQLALQVRYLDLHLRWNDMVRPDQVSRDVKGTENETSAYRNARICDKKIEEDNIRYGLLFHQKHLPSRVMKNSIDVEQTEDGEEKLWFPEIHVPLFLIKDYEQTAEKDSSPPAKALHILSKLQRIQLKAFRRDIFSYLMHKEERVDKCPCASCQKDLLLGDAVKCNECEGYCHKDCALRSTVDMKYEVDYVVTCKKCCAKVITLNENIVKTSVITKDSSMDGDFHPLASAGITDSHSFMKQTLPGPTVGSRGKRSRTFASYGVIWKKRDSEESGSGFRMSNILLRGNGDINPSKRPKCCLCSKPYNPDLMYILCEECTCWYHAEALQLDESQIFDVVGFKCCKCRRNRLPSCPYADPESKKPRSVNPVSKKPRSVDRKSKKPRSVDRESRKPRSVDSESRKPHSVDPESRKPRARVSKEQNIVMKSGCETFPKPLVEWEVTTTASNEAVEGIIEEDPLLFSLERVEPIPEFTTDFEAEWETAADSSQGPQKLPIRRHAKLENDSANQKLTVRRHSNENTAVKEEMFDYGGVNFEGMEFEPQTYFFGNASPPQAEWEFPVDGVKDEVIDYEGLNFEDMEFEPQTYFSFTELLATDDNQSSHCDGSKDMTGDLVNTAGGVPEQYGVLTGNNHQEHDTKSTIKAPCVICSVTEPAPELHCEVCGYRVHNRCSPWIESDWVDSWKCGNCRDWA